MASQAAGSAERIFTAADYVKDGLDPTVVSTYRDQDLVAIVEWCDPGKEFQPPTGIQRPRTSSSSPRAKGKP